MKNVHFSNITDPRAKTKVERILNISMNALAAALLHLTERHWISKSFLKAPF